MVDGELGIELILRQTIPLTADILPGEGLRQLLRELADACAALEAACKCAERDGEALRRRIIELEDCVATRLDAARCASAGAECRAHFVTLLNRKKQRIRKLDDALEDREAGGDALGGTLSEDAADGNDDDDGDDDHDGGPELADESVDAHADAMDMAMDTSQPWRARAVTSDTEAMGAQAHQGAGAGSTSRQPRRAPMAVVDDDQEDLVDLL